MKGTKRRLLFASQNKKSFCGSESKPERQSSVILIVQNIWQIKIWNLESEKGESFALRDSLMLPQLTNTYHETRIPCL